MKYSGLKGMGDQRRRRLFVNSCITYSTNTAVYVLSDPEHTDEKL